jgi:hypothetical protein
MKLLQLGTEKGKGTLDEKQFFNGLIRSYLFKILYALLNCLQCLAKCCQTMGQKDEKTSTGCRKDAGTLFLYLRANRGNKKTLLNIGSTYFSQIHTMTMHIML